MLSVLREEDKNGSVIGGSMGKQFTDWGKIRLNARGPWLTVCALQGPRAFSTELPK